MAANSLGFSPSNSMRKYSVEEELTLTCFSSQGIGMRFLLANQFRTTDFRRPKGLGQDQGMRGPFEHRLLPDIKVLKGRALPPGIACELIELSRISANVTKGAGATNQAPIAAGIPKYEPETDRQKPSSSKGVPDGIHIQPTFFFGGRTGIGHHHGRSGCVVAVTSICAVHGSPVRGSVPFGCMRCI